MKPSSGWISARGQYPKNYSGKKFRQKKNPQDVQGLTLYLGQIITHYLGLCCITNIVQHSVFVEFDRMNASRRKECKGYESGNPLAAVFLLREERYSRVICLIRKRRLLDRGARVRSLCPFPTAHPVMCAFVFSMHVLLCCVLLTSPWAFGDITIFVSFAFMISKLSQRCKHVRGL